MTRRPQRSPLFPSPPLFRSMLTAALAGAWVVERLRALLPPHHPRHRKMVRDLLYGADATDEMVLRSEEHTSELQSRQYLVCRLLLEKKKKTLQLIYTYLPLT